MTKIYKRNCANCRNYYGGVGKKYCSDKCRGQGEKENYRKFAEKGREIRWKKSKRGKFIICYCGKKRWVYPYEIKLGLGKYCSTFCSNKANASKLSEARKGKGNPMFGKEPWNYIDGKRIHKYAKRNWRLIAKKVREKYKNICQNCGYKKQKEDKLNLVVHHIKFVRNNGDDSFMNLISLCRKCHARLHANLLVLKGGDVL